MSDDWGQWIDVRKKLNARIRKQRELLDECEKAFVRVYDYSSEPFLVQKAGEMLAKLRAQEKADEIE